MERREYNTLIDKFKKRIAVDLDKGCYEQAMMELSQIVRIMHTVNDRLYDDDLEKYLMVLIKAFANESTNYGQNVLFYDSIFSDSTVLSRQYLQALIDLNIKFVYLVKSHVENDDSKDLIKMAQICENCIFIILKGNSNVERIEEIRRIIKDYWIGKVLIQSLSFDIAALAAFAGCENIQTFYINHMDDQFWIGSQCFNYYLNFSETVQEICIRERNIPRDKCVIHKYYPYIKEHAFMGMPFEYGNDQVVIFSGGRFTKIVDSENMYLNLVKRMLQENPKAIFLYAGSGDSTYMTRFIKDEPFLKERWYVIPYRSDLYELLQHVDVYLGTYPIKGGLMTLYAAYAGVPILELDDFTGFRSEELFTNPDAVKITYGSQEDLRKRAKILIDSKSERENVKKTYCDYLPDKERFCKKLLAILKGATEEKINDLSTDLNAEKLLHHYANTFESERKTIAKLLVHPAILRIYPTLFFKNLVDFFRCTDQTAMKTYFRKVLIKFGSRRNICR